MEWLSAITGVFRGQLPATLVLLLFVTAVYLFVPLEADMLLAELHAARDR